MPLFCIGRYHWLPPLYESASIAVLIGASILHPNTVFAQPLAWPPLAYLGVISYSVYVWQAPFMIFSGEGAVLAIGILMPLMALCSYYLIERPFVKLGRLFETGIPPVDRPKF